MIKQAGAELGQDHPQLQGLTSEPFLHRGWVRMSTSKKDRGWVRIAGFLNDQIFWTFIWNRTFFRANWSKNGLILHSNVYVSSWSMIFFTFKAQLDPILISVSNRGWVFLSRNITTSWLHLASWNLPESKMEPSVAIY